MDDETKRAALRLFACAYAAILEEPLDSALVQELALAAVDSATAAKHVVLHGHGLACGVWKAGKYRYSHIEMDGPPLRRE